MRSLVTALILLLPISLFAESSYFSLGLDVASQEFSGAGSDGSNFASQGYRATGGIKFASGVVLGAEYGSSAAINKISSHTYMETGSLRFYSAILGLDFTKIGVGVGYRHNDVTLKSLSTSGSGYLESEYSGWTPFGYMNYKFGSGAVRALAEAQYVTGNLKSSASTLPEVSFTEISMGLRLILLIP